MTEDPDQRAAAHLRGWIGRQETATDDIHPGPARRMQALLSRDPDLGAGDPLPPLWHWLYFTPQVRTDGLGPDGHPTRGGFLPPVALPRRMWAGGRFSFDAPLRLGVPVRRVSTIKDVTLKQGRSGHLAFVTVTHDLIQDGVRVLSEDHDIVYRNAPPAALSTNKAAAQPPTITGPAPPPPGALRETLTPGMPLLFRYSALTFNSHRIHYDQDYCREVEGYPGCIVHGPLIATLLVDLAVRSTSARLEGFDFRATSPAFHGRDLHLDGHANDQTDGQTLDLWAETEGRQAMQAQARFRPGYSVSQNT